MKKIIIPIVLILVAGGAVIYFFVAAPSGANNNFAAAVPAQTLFYARSSGNSKFAQSIKAIRTANVESMRANIDNYRKLAPRYGQAGRFVEGLFEAYADQVEQGKAIPGMPRLPKSVAYTVGLVPVLRMKLTDAAAFQRFLDEAEQRGRAHATAGSFQGVSYREYSIEFNRKPTRSALLVAVRPHYVVVTIDAPAFRDVALPVALGLKAPAKTLAQSGLLQRIADKNGFERGDIGFINHQAIVAALTGAPGSLAGKMLTQVDAKHQLAAVRTPACRRDMQSIANGWPITVMGMVPNNGAAPGDVVIRERMVSRLTDASLTKSLSQLRGHIPAALIDGSAKPILGFALGLDAAHLAPVLGGLQQRFVQADFHCDWLVKAQQNVLQKNPAARTAAAALFSGVRGVSLEVFDANPAAGVAGLDALVDISATSPRRLFQMAKRMKPRLLGQVQIPADGSPVALQLPRKGVPPVQVMIAGKHLVFFMGPTAAKAAQGLKNDKLTPNGVVYYRIDYAKAMPLMAAFLVAHHQGQMDAAALQKLKKSVDRMSKLKLRIRALLDFGQDGVVLKGRVAAAKPQPAG
ncbi:MAG TPA: hypothetical protein VFM97_02930 [Gammaproteobacteria bacterium]|nr:hypothetical protein [Gammaproteobacteria bacterium]